MRPELLEGTAGLIHLSMDTRTMRVPTRKMGSFLNPASNWRERVGEALGAMAELKDIKNELQLSEMPALAPSQPTLASSSSEFTPLNGPSDGSNRTRDASKSANDGRPKRLLPTTHSSVDSLSGKKGKKRPAGVLTPSSTSEVSSSSNDKVGAVDKKSKESTTKKVSHSKRKKGEISENFVRLNLKRKGTTRYRKVKVSKLMAR